MEGEEARFGSGKAAIEQLERVKTLVQGLLPSSNFGLKFPKDDGDTKIMFMILMPESL